MHFVKSIALKMRESPSNLKFVVVMDSLIAQLLTDPKPDALLVPQCDSRFHRELLQKLISKALKKRQRDLINYLFYARLICSDTAARKQIILEQAHTGHFNQSRVFTRFFKEFLKDSGNDEFEKNVFLELVQIKSVK